MGLLTYWSLEQYAHLAVVAQAKRALTKQLSALMLSQWHRHRHICENFGPAEDTLDCTGTHFYHWGALNGYIALVEAGHWSEDRPSAAAITVSEKPSQPPTWPNVLRQQTPESAPHFDMFPGYNALNAPHLPSIPL